MTDPTRRHAAKVLESLEHYHQLRASRISELEALGYRIVNGGQTSGWYTDDHGREVTDAQMTDWRTGEVLVVVTGSDEDYAYALDAADPTGRWWHIDHVDEDLVNLDEIEVERLPASLGRAIRDWISDGSVSPDDIAEWSGWPLARVKEIRTLDGL